MAHYNRRVNLFFVFFAKTPERYIRHKDEPANTNSKHNAVNRGHREYYVRMRIPYATPDKSAAKEVEPRKHEHNIEGAQPVNHLGGFDKAFEREDDDKRHHQREGKNKNTKNLPNRLAPINGIKNTRHTKRNSNGGQHE